MPDLIMEPTPAAQWQRLVQEAAGHAHQELDETLESYLVLLMIRFTENPETGHRIMALDYLRGLRAAPRAQAVAMRDVGDHCLLFSGLFSQRARRRRVSVGYFVDLGRSAYQQVADRQAGGSLSDLFGALAHGFMGLSDVLRAMRELGGAPGLSALEALELWQEQGSQQARQVLEGLTDATPQRGTETRQ
ncbi:MAG: hypothetical protein ABR558_07845 [Thioalkalivibrio sp.]